MFCHSIADPDLVAESAIFYARMPPSVSAQCIYKAGR